MFVFSWSSYGLCLRINRSAACSANSTIACHSIILNELAGCMQASGLLPQEMLRIFVRTLTAKIITLDLNQNATVQVWNCTFGC